MLIMSIVLFVGYAAAKTRRDGGLPESLSKVGFTLGSSKRKWLWTLWLAATAECLSPCLFDAVTPDWYATAHVFVTALMLLSLLPHVSDGKSKAHYVLGFVAGIFSQVCVAVVCAWWFLVWSLLILLYLCSIAHVNSAAILPKWIEGKGVFVFECLCAMSLYGSLITHITT